VFNILSNRHRIFYTPTEDALSEKDAIITAYHPYGDPYGENYPTEWDNFYNKWLALDLSSTGGYPSVLLMSLLVITAPFYAQ